MRYASGSLLGLGLRKPHFSQLSFSLYGECPQLGHVAAAIIPNPNIDLLLVHAGWIDDPIPFKSMRDDRITFAIETNENPCIGEVVKLLSHFTIGDDVVVMHDKEMA
jgi:hypothetical protein